MEQGAEGLEHQLTHLHLDNREVFILIMDLFLASHIFGVYMVLLSFISSHEG